MSQQPLTRVLIVDDEPNVATMLAISLETLGEDYIFDIAHNGDEAINKIQETNYKLLITDYNMPGMTGLDLIQATRQLSPQTQVILMTAYGTERLRHLLEHWNLDGYIDKPFPPAQIREIVQQAINRVRAATLNHASAPAGQPVIDSAITEHLKSLHYKTGCHCVLLVSSTGYPLSIEGWTQNLDVTAISALVAGNFMAAAELANLLGSNRVFKSSYHEADDYNIYAYDVNGEFLLTVIFGAESKPGVVWFYTKQTAAELKPLLVNQTTHYHLADDQAGLSVDNAFDGLFDSDENGNFSTTKLTMDQPLPQLELEPVKLLPVNQVARSGSNGSKVIIPPQPANKTPKPMTFAEAVAAGLVPAHIAQRETKQA